MKSIISGLAEGGHIDGLQALAVYNNMESWVVQYGMEAAIRSQNLFTYFEIHRIFGQQAIIAENQIWERQTLHPLTKEYMDSPLERVKSLNDLLTKINEEIKRIEEEGVYLPSAVREKHGVVGLSQKHWAKPNLNPSFPQKHLVLTELKKYLLGQSDREKLDQITGENPLYKGDYIKSTTEQLLATGIKKREKLDGAEKRERRHAQSGQLFKTAVRERLGEENQSSKDHMSSRWVLKKVGSLRTNRHHAQQACVRRKAI